MDLREERELVEEARRDPEAFGALYERYYSQIFGYVLRRVANVEIAQDLSSEVFFKALKNLGRFRWQNISFSSWLYRIASNQTTDYFRKDGHRAIPLEEFYELAAVSGLSAEAEILQAEDELKKHEDFLILHKNIARLPSKYQEVITLRFFENKHIKEIGEILGKKEGTIKALLHRGLKKLRKLME